MINPLNGELNPTCHLLALLGTHPILHVSRIRVNQNLNFKIRGMKGMTEETRTGQQNRKPLPL